MSNYLNYIDQDYKPSKNDLICEFFIKPKDPNELDNAIGGVAAESSIGTWTETATAKSYMAKLAAKVFYIKKIGNNSANIKIAYPSDLFELGNVPDIMSSIAGNVFGMKEVDGLRLNDIIFPKNIVKSFKGPKYGIEGVRKIIGIKDRPLMGTIVKPKIGLNVKDHAQVAYDAWLGGCDVVKDDENLSSQKFNKFEDRLKETVKMKEKAEKITGEKKMYMINVTAETKEMLRRAKLVEDSGNEYAMVDVVTVGWSALQTLRDANFNLVLHAHRAGHAAFDRNVEHGINMKVVARIVRMIGLDQLHIGTAVGKMFETHDDVIENIKALTEEFYGVKKVFPVASGGLEPLMAPALYNIMGKEVIMQFGGGIHGHPQGTIAGATAARQAIDAAMKKISLEEYAKSHKELKQALEKWGKKI
ncbi:MAG: type III ribulose-bisphosphate carboxylase [Candidatus Nanoarchaeia archaeon]|nr:type III ribulose-bisphosphate carboxylase [Candidatus Nanoarchaeia archaeon]MDD5741341.1 type III ribulose-bisphosphate carboxylase [Candidatus Nanoarchaeia archaeon]